MFMAKLMRWMLVLLLLSAGSVGAGWYYLQSWMNAPLSLEQPLLYQVQSGRSLRSVDQDLARQGVIDSPYLLYAYARLTQQAGLIKAGEYQLTPGTTVSEMLTMMQRGDVVRRAVTLVEGLRLADYIALLARQEGLKPTEAPLTTQFVAQALAIKSAPPEGWFFPDTYNYTRADSALDVLKRAHHKMNVVLKQEWENRQPDLPLKTPYEALVLASIVEKETGAPSERQQIAGVFVRRLAKKMRLQTDPTVIYGLGDSYKGNITRKHLRQMTPYNTYRIAGLPPTPIANPGREAIHAAVNPAPGKALYFVAMGDGRHQFSATLVEHNRAVKRYQLGARRSDYRSAPTQSADEG